MNEETVHSRRKTGRAWRWARIVGLALITWSVLAWAAAEALIVRSEMGNADALVVLAGSSTYLERTHRAAQLFREARAPIIILTNDNVKGGWSHDEQRNPFFVELAAAELKRLGVPAEKIEVAPGVVSSTYEEAGRLHEYASANNLRSLLIVTSAYQSRRALWTLRRVFHGSGVKIGLDAVAPGEQAPGTATWWWHPLGWQMVGGEYVKMIYYWLHY